MDKGIFMEKFQQNRKAWFKGFKSLTKGRYKKPAFIYLGEKVTAPSIILSNHEGTDAPMSLELYADFPLRFWGAWEMNSGLKNLYRYQTQVYYHQKKHWNLHLARLFCLLASPLTYIFYKGLRLVSTYHDHRFAKTIQESMQCFERGESIIIFPEKSDGGYQKQLQGFFAGFVILAEAAYKRGDDIDIFTAYLRKDEKKYIFAAPVKYSALKEQGLTPEQMATVLLDSCNALADCPLPEPTA